ncbi:hypothetical protein NC652_000176 [Populus alba x Populus x berolinensis]|nr:hypothetical protein NC652_000176 [Populus alba x Populus x berolinensis]
MELEGLFDSLSECWEQWPCSSFSS